MFEVTEEEEAYKVHLRRRVTYIETVTVMANSKMEAANKVKKIGFEGEGSPLNSTDWEVSGVALLNKDPLNDNHYEDSMEGDRDQLADLKELVTKLRESTE